MRTLTRTKAVDSAVSYREVKSAHETSSYTHAAFVVLVCVPESMARYWRLLGALRAGVHDRPFLVCSVEIREWDPAVPGVASV